MGLFGTIVKIAVATTAAKGVKKGFDAAEERSRNRQLDNENKKLEKLERLHRLYECDAISEREYKRRKRELL